MWDKISDKESYWGEVVDVVDSKKSSRVRVRVATVFDDIPTDAIPWAIPRYLDNHGHDLPAIGDIVQIKFLNEDVMFPTWYRNRHTTTLLSDDDYPSAAIVIEKDLSRYDLDGNLGIRWTKSEGLVIELTRHDILSTFIIRNDNSIFMENGKTGQIFHISNESMSMGSETISQQPMVVGNDNKEALHKLNAMVKSLANLTEENMKLIAIVAASSPYTRRLSKPIKSYGEALKSLAESIYSDNESFFPETLSQIGTVDKT